MARTPKATKPNPGPWSYFDIGIIEDNDGNCLAECVNGPNGELMAAAPDLLKALVFITDQLERVGDDRKDAPFIDAARAAITKALGDA